MRTRNRIAAVLLAGTMCLSAMPTYALAETLEEIFDTTEEIADTTDESSDTTDESSDTTEESSDTTEESSDTTKESSDTTVAPGKIANDSQYAKTDATDGAWVRKGGENRYDTMEQVVKATFDKSYYAILASGETYADALLANGLAGTIKCPVILTARNQLSAQAESEIERLGVTNIYIVGNTNAVSAEVESDLSMRGCQVKRLAGGSDQETSIKVLEECRKAGSPSENVIIAAGNNFTDALSISPWAYASGSPILFTNASGTLSDAQIDALKRDGKFKHALVIGGTSAVSDAVAKQLGTSIEGWRIGGTDRYDTSAKVADWCVTHGGLTYTTPVLTTATNFPDALCGAALAAKNKSVLVVADKYTDKTIERLQKNASLIQGGYIVGGKNAMPISNPLVNPQAQSDASEVRGAIAMAAAGGVTTEDGQTANGSSEEVESFR